MILSSFIDAIKWEDTQSQWKLVQMKKKIVSDQSLFQLKDKILYILREINNIRKAWEFQVDKSYQDILDSTPSLATC